MNKSELINVISAKTGYTKKSVKEILTSFTDVTMHQVAKNDKVMLVGFGTFSKRRRAARKIKGFEGDIYKKGATTIPFFTAGGDFKKIVRKGK